MSVVDATHDVVALGALTAVLFLAVAVAAAWIARVRPGIAVVTLLAAAPFDLQRYVGPTTVTTEKAALLGVAVGLITMPAIRAQFAGLRRVPLAWCALALVVATAITWPHALSHIAVARETLKAVQYLVTFALAWAAARVDPDDEPLLAAVPALVCAVALGALAQLVTGAPSGLYIGDVPFPRIAGPLEGPNQLAGYLGLLLPLVLLRAGTPLGRAATFLGTAALVLTLSRSGIVAGAVGLGIALWRLAPALRRPSIAWLASGAVAGVAALVAIGQVLSHSNGALAHLLSAMEIEKSGGVGTRSELWHGAWTLWRRHPLFGIGAGNFELEIGGITKPNIRTHANSWYFQSAVEGGLPLLAATLATVWYACGDLVRRASTVPLVGAIAAGSIGLSLHQIADFLVFYPKVGATWWIVLGVAAARVART